MINLTGCSSDTNPEFAGFSPHNFNSAEHNKYLQQTNWDVNYCYNCHSNPEGSNRTATDVSCSDPGCHDITTQGPLICNNCHGNRAGDPLQPVNWAPPRSLNGDNIPSFPGVGAHQAHLTVPSGIFHPVECSTCHTVPGRWNAAGHIKDATPGRAEVIFSGVARARNALPGYDLNTPTCSSTHCHGAAQPVWTSSEGVGCGDCHSLPPPPPHPSEDDCSDCHGSVIDDYFNIIAPELHANGYVNEG